MKKGLQLTEKAEGVNCFGTVLLKSSVDVPDEQKTQENTKTTDRQPLCLCRRRGCGVPFK